MPDFTTAIKQNHYGISIDEGRISVRGRDHTFEFTSELLPKSRTRGTSSRVYEIIKFNIDAGEITKSDGLDSAKQAIPVKREDPELQSFREPLAAIISLARKPRFPKDLASKFPTVQGLFTGTEPVIGGAELS